MDRLVVVWFILNMFSFTIVCADYQVDALIAMKDSLNDPNGVMSGWYPNIISACPWDHINCDANASVIAIYLANYGLSGKLAKELGKLDKLQYLEMHHNQLNGSIPIELGNLPNLVSLDLYNNKLTGLIPLGLGYWRSLNFMRLNDNNLSGCITVEALAAIPVVDISNNPLMCNNFTKPLCPKDVA